MATQVEPIRITRGQVSVADLVVKTKADHKRALATVAGLMARPRTAEEDALLDVLADLIEKFESRAHPGLGHHPTPVETMRFRMEQNKLSQRKVGNRRAALLGKRFKISPAVFVTFGL